VEQAVIELSSELGEREACARLGYARPTFRRHQQLVPASAEPIVHSQTEVLAAPRQQRRYEARQAQQVQARAERARRRSSLALSEAERQTVLDAVHQPRFINRSVPTIQATLLDEGTYCCSKSTMYRILHDSNEVGERRAQACRPAHVKPELCATEPNRVWAWDITKLHGPQKWTYYYLYVVIDIYSRNVVGWLLADRESSELARVLLAETIRKECVNPKLLTIHADRGSSMGSKPVAFLLADLGVTKSHSRPHVSNDNPHIESLFKTVKYQPEFPSSFPNIVEARAFCRAFFEWYNNEHRHSAIAYLTPADVHQGRAAERLQRRQLVLDRAFAAHPERFVRGKPSVPQLPVASYINRPPEDIDTAA
jgi:putative transposase